MTEPNPSQPEEILRIAAKGDGVTASGRFAWGAAPGDLVAILEALQQVGALRAQLIVI